MLCVIVNTLAFPGLGSIMARRAIGFVQVGLTLAGFIIFMGFMLWFFAGLLQVAGDYAADMQQFQDAAKSRAWIAALGLALVFVAWIWAVFTSIGILRAARAQGGPPPVPPVP